MITPADSTPLPIYALGAILGALTFLTPILIAAYLTSDFHARGLARLRRHRQKGR